MCWQDLGSQDRPKRPKLGQMRRRVKIEANHFKVACTLTRASLLLCMPLFTPALASIIQWKALYNKCGMVHVWEAGAEVSD